MAVFIRRHVCGVGPNYPTEVKKNETMRLGLENPAAYTDNGWPYKYLILCMFSQCNSLIICKF
jgi:hypothetical protein